MKMFSFKTLFINLSCQHGYFESTAPERFCSETVIVPSFNLTHVRWDQTCDICVIRDCRIPRGDGKENVA